MLTYTLRNGAVVLAKLYKGNPVPYTYSNRKQAEAAAERVGGTVHQFLGRPFYVVLPDEPSVWDALDALHANGATRLNRIPAEAR